MAQKISKRLQARVLDILRIADTPLTTREVAMLVNRSYEATRQALALVGAERVDSSFPTEWKIADSNMPDALKKVPSKFDEVSYTVSTKDVVQLVQVWNSQREATGKAMTDTEITPDSNPKDLAIKLGTVAGSLAALAYQLSEVATRPDWFDVLTKER